MPYLRREHAFGYAVGSLHLAALALGSLLGAAASRRVELAAGRRVLVAAGMGAMGVGALGIAVAPAVAGTLAAALVMGVGGASSLVGAQGALADRHGERRAVALGEANVAASAGQLAVPLLVAGGVAVGVGWQPALVAGALLGAALAWRVTVAGIHDPPAAPAARLARR